MFDVFYTGSKPGLFPHEVYVTSIQEAKAKSRTRYCWIITYLADYSGWDFLWEPVPWQNQYVHVWPSQWHDYSGTFLVPTNTDTLQYHFHDTIIPNKAHPDDFQIKVPGAVFDWTWSPHPLDPPYIYVFGNQWWPATKWSTVEYHVPGATERKFMDSPQALLPHKHTDHWRTLQPCDWDFSWQPDPGDPPYIYVFGNQWWPAEKMPTVEYRVPGAVDRKFMHHPKALLPSKIDYWWVPEYLDGAALDLSWVPDPGAPPYIYQFGTQHQKTGGPRYVVPGATEIDYVSSPRFHKSSVDSHWEIPADAVYSKDFDWTWHPDVTDRPYIYQFGTQHQKTGGPRYVVPGATEIKYIDQIKITVESSQAPVYVIDHMDGRAETLRDSLSSRLQVAKITRYVDNYLDTLKRIAASVSDHVEHIWIVSSICDYEGFDFTWYPEQWQATMLHVFASGQQKFGDTFFMHVPTFQIRSETCKLLDWYDVNYVPDLSVPRRPMPMICHDQDSHVDQVLQQEWKGPLALFTNHDTMPEDLVTVPLWREATKTIVPLSAGASAVIVPKVSVPYIRTQLYDYPYIDRTHRVLMDDPLDVVFISNGEHGAEHHYDVLQGVLRNHGARNQLHRVDGVKGRVAAYQAAANQSHTPWFFAVFAKLQVNEDFDWGWQPDRMQQPKHYIFHAYNPVNHLTYGHQAMIAYNVAMTMTNTGEGLDFTLDQPHEVVPVLSGTAYYDNDPWTCWRTAFREAIKLRHSLPDVESEYRLAEWLSKGDGINGHWSMRGAQDAVQYYEDVKDDFAEIKKSYEWAWLAAYAMMVQPELVTQSRT